MPIHIHIRLPEDIHAALKRIAQRHKRSLTKEIEVALEDYAHRSGEKTDPKTPSEDAADE